MNRTKLGLCMLYLRNEVNTTHIYFRIIDFRIHYFRDPVVNPPEFRKTSLTGRFFVDGVDLGLKFAVRNTQFFSEPEKRCKWNPQGYRFLDKSIYHISTWVTYPILLHDFLMYDIDNRWLRMTYGKLILHAILQELHFFTEMKWYCPRGSFAGTRTKRPCLCEHSPSKCFENKIHP